MRRIALLSLTAFAIAGCQAPIEERLAGNWSGPQNSTVTIAKDKKWNSTINAGMTALKTEGTWSASGDTVTMTPVTINGQPAAALVDQITKMGKAMGAKEKDLANIKQLGAPDDFTLSSDGKTLTLKNPKNGPMTLTKQ